jgi:hypothetical protein
LIVILTVYKSIGFVSVASEIPDDNVAMYVGLGIAVAVFITVIFVIVFLLRRKKSHQTGVYGD